MGQDSLFSATPTLSNEESWLDIRTLLLNAQERVNRIQAELTRNSAELSFWRNLMTYQEKAWPFHILALLQKEGALQQRLRAENPSCAKPLAEIQRSAQQQTVGFWIHFPTYLEEECRKQSLQIDRASRHPRYTFDEGFLTLEAMETKGMVRLSDYEGRLAEIPADVVAVVQTLQTERKRLMGRKFDGKAFLSKLYGHYRAILKKKNESEGAALPIRSITGLLGKNKRGFRSDEFLIDLSKLVREGPFEINGLRLDLQQTRDEKLGMMLQSKSELGYIGFIAFRRT